MNFEFDPATWVTLICLSAIIKFGTLTKYKQRKGMFIRLPITLIPLPILQTKVIFVIPWVVQTKRPIILHHGIREVSVCADIRLREDVVAFISTKFALHRNTSNPLKLYVGVVFRIHGLEIRESTIDSPQEMIADMLTLSIRIQPLPILP